MGDRSDLEELRAARTGAEREERLAALFARHRSRLTAMVSLRLDERIRGRLDSSDVIQEAFLDSPERFSVARYAADGTPSWTAESFQADTAHAAAVAFDPDGNAVAVGNLLHDPCVGTDFAIAKYSPSGAEVWARRLHDGTAQSNSPFIRGDMDGSGFVDTWTHLFFPMFVARSSFPWDNLDAVDVNDDGRIDVTDVLALLGYWYLGQPLPPPGLGAPGVDPTPDCITATWYRNAPAPQSGALALGFTGCPAEVLGARGEVKTFEVTVTLSSDLDAGAQAWSFGVSAENLEIVSIAIDGTDAANAHPLGPAAEVVGVSGAFSAVVLDLDRTSWTPYLLPPRSTSTVARIGVRAAIPEAEVEGRLSFVDGIKGSGEPVEDIVSVGGVSYAPRVTGCSFPIRAPDCNGNGVPDALDIETGTSADCTGNGIPDECEPDCDRNGVADTCDLAAGTSLDCNRNGIPDRCDIAEDTSEDCDLNGVPDECQPDCDGDAMPDSCAIASGKSEDCNGNAIPDECDVGWTKIGFDEPRPIGPGDVFHEVALADLDGDGLLDLAGTTETGAEVAFGDGAASFGEAVLVPVATDPIRAWSLTIADIDVDGTLDLAIACGGGLAVLSGTGDGTFGAAARYPSNNDGVQLAVGDVDKDGFPDAATGGPWGNYGGFSVFRNRRDGTFAPGIEYGNLTFYIGSIVIADLSRDGIGDIATGNGLWLKGRAGADPVSAGTYSTSGVAEPIVLRNLAAVDLSGDGPMDLVRITGGVTSVFVNAGTGAFRTPVNFTTGGFNVVVADLDGDGDPDIATDGTPADGGRLILNSGKDKFATPIRIPMAEAGASLSQFQQPLVAADLDGDGLLDLVQPMKAGGVAFLRNHTVRPASPDLDGNGAPDSCDPDCNENGIPDALDLSSGVLHDTNSDGIPDECKAIERFRRGDTNNDGVFDISDPVNALGFLFTGAGGVTCMDAADSNDDGLVDLSDAVASLSNLFLGGPPPGTPGPATCGEDPPPADLLDCASYPGCGG
jgi:hypothetical protein